MRSSTEPPWNVRQSQHGEEGGSRQPERGAAGRGSGSSGFAPEHPQPASQGDGGACLPVAPPPGHLPTLLVPPPSLESGLDSPICFSHSETDFP